MAAHPDGLACISATTAYPYVETPMLLLLSSEDTVIRCSLSQVGWLADWWWVG